MTFESPVDKMAYGVLLIIFIRGLMPGSLKLNSEISQRYPSTLFTDISETMSPKIIVNSVFESSKHVI